MKSRRAVRAGWRECDRARSGLRAKQRGARASRAHHDARGSLPLCARQPWPDFRASTRHSTPFSPSRSPTRWSRIAAARGAPPARPTSTPPTPSSGMRPGRRLAPVAKVNRVEMALLRGIDRVRDILVDNTERFARGPAGQQRAAVGRARHGQVVAGQGGACRDQPRRDAGRAPLKLSRSTARTSRACRTLMALLRDAPHRFIVFCDDLSFDGGRHLLQVAEGGARRRHRGTAGQRRSSTPPRTAATCCRAT